MTHMQTMWVDSGSCQGCGLCVEACPTGAIALVEDRARIDEALCTSCQACVDACPHHAIQPIITAEIVPAAARTVPASYRTSLPANALRTTIATVGMGLLVQAGQTLIQIVNHWLAQQAETAGPAMRTSPRDRDRPRGRRIRRRRRGG
jgi:NAD-dependent dihydropyrimidine dehydrogenase PreA subunit